VLTQQTGKRAEQAALDYLRQAGLKLITRNFNGKRGEIDLIMSQRGQLQRNILVFIEVRYRRSTAYGGAGASVNHTKRSRIIRTASRFLQTHSKYQSWPCRFDVIAVTGPANAMIIKWLVSAFDA
jgi:putative endonuclease